MGKSKYDWNAAHAVFLSDCSVSLADVARRLGIPPTSVYRKASVEKWVDERDALNRSVINSVKESYKETQENLLAKMREVSDKLDVVLVKAASKLDEVLERLENDDEPYDAITKLSRAAADLAKGSKDGLTFRRGAYDIPTPAELEAWELAKQRLELERRKVEETLKDTDKNEVKIVIAPANDEDVQEYAK